MNTISKLWRKLSRKQYRTAFVESQMSIGIPFQIRAMLKSRGWTQEDLAKRAGMRQPSISNLMKPGKVRPNIETLRRLAEAFDCGLAVRFVPFSEIARWSVEFDPENHEVPGFADDVKPAGEDDVTVSMPAEQAEAMIASLRQVVDLYDARHQRSR